MADCENCFKSDVCKYYESKSTVACEHYSVPVYHGNWIEVQTHNGCTPDYDCVCSICGKSGMPAYNFCPNCGARMDGGE